MFLSNLLWITIIKRPNTTAVITNILFITPSTVNESRIKMVEIMNPEFRITLWNWSV